jgi:replication-associated recombination protein RarA
MPYTEKYQPQNLGQCLYPEQATEDLIKDFAANATDANLILYGPMGTGKSLMAKLIADELSDIGSATLETFQGALLRTPTKVEAVIDQMERWNRSKNFFASRRLYIIEEFDRVHYDSQLGFGHLMTTPGVQFILTTNAVENIDDRILSRARVCNISGATQKDMLTLAQHVVTSEGVTATQTELTKLTVSAAGNVRDLMLDLEVLVLSKRKQSAQTAASQVITPLNVTAPMAQRGAGTAPAPVMLPTVSLITPSTSLGQPTP